MNRALVIALAVLVGALVLSDAAWRRKRIVRDLHENISGEKRYVDAGITLHVVVGDAVNGTELVPDKPPLRIIRTHHFGGMIDTAARPPKFCGRSKSPVVWYCSEQQEEVLLHKGNPLGLLVYGSEGAGKTRVLAMWHALRWLEHMGDRPIREGGQTAPTDARLQMIETEMIACFRPSWYRYFTSPKKRYFRMCDGTRIRLRSTYRQSKAQGPAIQGWNWSWAGRDEAQDQVAEHNDIESRGRASRHGGTYYRQLATATAKDDTDWKNLRDQMIAGGQWDKRTLSIYFTPLVSRGFLEQRAASMSPREFLRRYGKPDGTIDDLPLERADYPTWSRKYNLIVIPDIHGWEDITAQELARFGENLHALGGHDPGSLFDVTEILKCYRRPTRLFQDSHGVWRRGTVQRWSRPFWVVRDEITTELTTTEQHVMTFLARIREEWNLNILDRNDRPVLHGPQILVRADPYGNNDSKPDRSCYTVFKKSHVKIRPAAYSEANPTDPGRVPKREGIEVVTTLFCSALGLKYQEQAEQFERDGDMENASIYAELAQLERRLYIEKLPDGTLKAPMLVNSIESNEKDERGRSEMQRKNVNDLSHWSAALRYAVWAVERPRLQLIAEGRA